MGGVFSKCTSKHVHAHSDGEYDLNQDYTHRDDDDDLNLEDFTALRTDKIRQQVETNFDWERTEYRHRSGNKTAIRIRRSASSKNTSVLYSQEGSVIRRGESFISTHTEQGVTLVFEQGKGQRKAYKRSESFDELVDTDYSTFRGSRSGNIRRGESFISTHTEQDVTLVFEQGKGQRKAYKRSESFDELVDTDYSTFRGSRSGNVGSEKFTQSQYSKCPQHRMITPDEPPIDYEPGDNIYSSPAKESKTVAEVHVQKSLQVMAEKSTTENVSCEKDFKVLAETNFLPRYHYHRFLLDWVFKGLQAIPEFPVKTFQDCTVIIGGDISDKNISLLFGENRECNEVLADLKKGTLNEADVLVVYFLNNKSEHIPRRIDDFDREIPYSSGSLLFVMQNDGFVDESSKLTLIEALSKSRMNDISVIAKNRSEIITKMTCILEQRFPKHLEDMRINLNELPLNENVDSSLLEVSAVLRRLKQAACYPGTLPEEDDIMKEETIPEMLQNYGEKILYHGFDGDMLHIITTDTSVKERIIDFFTESKFRKIKYTIHVENALGVSFLAKEGTPLHGAKFVYVNEGLQAFHQDQQFATTGSLMMANGALMVIVTARHAFNHPANIHVLIDSSVVKLGREMQHLHGNMSYLHDDITIVEIENDAVTDVDNKCEKLLIDISGLPTPARIAERQLNVGDIVHKRGARTGLTTGVVTRVEVENLRPFTYPSLAIRIVGRGPDFVPFAGRGDSGSLVFQHSLSPEGNTLDVLAMVQGLLETQTPTHNPPVVCFPFVTGCQTVRQATGLQSLQFFNV